MRAAEVGVRANRNEQKGHVMKMLSLNKVATLAAVLTVGSVSIASGALANGGGGVGGEFIAGDRLATGGNFSCSEPIGDSCPNDDTLPLRSIERFKMTAHSHKGTEPYRYRY